MARRELNIRGLSGEEFQQLAIQVLRHQFAIPFEEFATGPDAGVDAAADQESIGIWHFDSSKTKDSKDFISNQNIRVQVKHTSKTNANLSASVYTNEGPKVAKLVQDKKLDVYLFVTSYSISVRAREKCIEFFKEKGAKHVKVIGMETLTSWVNDSPFLAGDLYKIFGVGHPMHRKMKKAESYAIYVKEMNKTFVSTKTSKEVPERLEGKRYVTITGPSCTGKSAIAENVAAIYVERKGFVIHKVSCGPDFDELLEQPRMKQLLVADDIFGKEPCDRLLGRDTGWLLENALMDKKGELRVLMTSCKNKFENAGLRSERRAFMNRSTFDLSEANYEDEEKKAIIESHVKKSKMSQETKDMLLSADYVSQIASMEPPFYFPDLAVLIEKVTTDTSTEPACLADLLERCKNELNDGSRISEAYFSKYTTCHVRASVIMKKKTWSKSSYHHFK